MIKQVNKKLRSQSGASIIMALFLFTVCAVLSAVIITASTAAAGRMATTAEVDQRYYSVTSAAEVLKGLIDNRPVRVEEIETVTSERTYADGIPGSTSESAITLVKVIGTDIGFSEDSEVTVYSYDADGTEHPYAGTFQSIQKDAAYTLYTHNTYTNRVLDLTSTAGESLNVMISQTLWSDGRMQFDLSNKEGKRFIISMIFEPQITETTDSTYEDRIGSPWADNSGKVYYKETSETTNTTITEINWTLKSIESYNL